MRNLRTVLTLHINIWYNLYTKIYAHILNTHSGKCHDSAEYLLFCIYKLNRCFPVYCRDWQLHMASTPWPSVLLLTSHVRYSCSLLILRIPEGHQLQSHADMKLEQDVLYNPDKQNCFIIKACYKSMLHKYHWHIIARENVYFIVCNGKLYF